MYKFRMYLGSKVRNQEQHTRKLRNAHLASWHVSLDVLLLQLFTENILLYSGHPFIDVLNILNQNPNDTFQSSINSLPQPETMF